MDRYSARSGVIKADAGCLGFRPDNRTPLPVEDKDPGGRSVSGRNQGGAGLQVGQWWAGEVADPTDVSTANATPHGSRRGTQVSRGRICRA